MAHTFANTLPVPYEIIGNKRLTVTDVTVDTSAHSGGYAITAAQLGLTKVDRGQAAIKTVSGTTNVTSAVVLPQTDGSILLKTYDETPAEVTSDLGSCVFTVTAVGT